MNKDSPTVSKLILRSKETARGYNALLGDDEAMLSSNKVTGLSLNFPIAETCKPSKLCVKTCYFAKGGSSWPNALKRQYRLLNSVKANPIGAAIRLEKELLRKRTKPSFLRWNGGGDLFAESVKMLNHLASLMPDLPIWVVTRIPSLAAKIKQAENVFVHFSLDAHSGKRRWEFEELSKLTKNYFYSYQCDKGEEPTPEELEGISVVFYDCYKPPAQLPQVDKDIICALNTEKDITGVCAWCRRCFNGAAVAHSKLQTGNHT
ncbi:hypothetical protein OAG84_03425 [Akkermansiaceae bacterium]|nr:hypothetical protein [Akkermansiaceae bacterium]